MPKFYAVRRGRNPGVYMDWLTCEQQVKGFSGASFKSFPSLTEANQFVSGTPSLSISEPTIKSDKLIIYTDGACPNNGNATCAGIGVHFPDGSHKDLSEPFPGPIYSNNRAEIYAVIRALQLTQGPVIIYTDSTQVINTMTEWLPKRLATNWHCLNSELYQQLYALSKDREVEYRHVSAHSGITGNEIADRLAVAGCYKD